MFKAGKVNKKTDLMFVAKEIAKSILLDYEIATLKKLFLSAKSINKIPVLYQYFINHFCGGEKKKDFNKN